MSIAQQELFVMFENANKKCNRALGIISGVIISFGFYLDNAAITNFSIIASMFLILIIETVVKSNTTSALEYIGNTIFSIIYIAFPLSHIMLIKEMGQGVNIIFFILLSTWLGDIFAYYIGRTIGRHKLMPEISPNKTIEGAGGCIIGGLVGAFISRIWFLPHVSSINCIYLGLICSIGGQLGDLGESLIKRNLNCKDSGKLLPGHGGLMDRIDSLIFSIPIVYYYIYFNGL